MNSKIKNVIQTLKTDVLSSERKMVLQPLIDFISQKKSENKPIRINFICTHNSRRSHLGQIWAQTMAAFFKVNNVVTYSGGTETTAMFPKVGETLLKQGFVIHKLSETNNPVYAINFDKNSHPIIAFLIFCPLSLSNLSS